MASERLVALQAEIEAKQLEVERIIAEEAKKNTVPPLIDALEEVLSAQAFADEANLAQTSAGNAWANRDPNSNPHVDAAKAARQRERANREALKKAHTNEDPGWYERHQAACIGEATRAGLEALMYETCVASTEAGAAVAIAKDKMHKALLNQAREDAETKRENANMFETLFAQMRTLQARVTTLEEEKAAKDRLAEETIRSLGYIPV
jgi:hypothetical protein